MDTMTGIFLDSSGVRRRVRIAILTACSWLLCAQGALATPPTVYGLPAYQSPVRGDPGDLVLLAGDGFSATDTVVYQAITDTTQPLSPPAAIPASSNANSGVAQVVSVLNVPHSLTAVLPTVAQTDQSYALWVRDSQGEWSNGVMINDARPLWITPDSVFATAPLAALPRYLKVVGRNLQPVPGATTQVRLLGPATYTLTASNDGNPATAIERYSAQVTLPANMPVGTYAIQVSRDGVSWVTLTGQALQVLADPVSQKTFPVSQYGCAPNDGNDDTPCIVQAIAAARANGGGVVTFDAGVWNMSNDSAPGVVYFGVLVPVGVSISGAGASLTTIQRDTTWNMQKPIFTLQGKNTVQGITFRDAYTYVPSSPGRTLLQLGVAPSVAQAYNPGDPSDVSDVVITQNVFDKPFVAVQDGGMPIHNLYVTYNEFGAYFTGLFVDVASVLSDSVVAFNTFKPGSYIDPSVTQGTIATQLSAGQRVDFSNNTADGTSTQYLYNPSTDAKGWRASFFWAMHGSHENVLISQNTATCTGDKAGDGEAFSFDNNGNFGALPGAQMPVGATANTISLAGPLTAQSNGTAYPSGYFNDFWVTVTQGPGQGQVRRIVSYSDPSTAPITFTVSPAWDVIPQATSEVTIAREFWQVYTVDNFVDQRQPLCTKNNANKPSGGVIGLYAQTADSAVEGNRQYDTSGILLASNYLIADQYSTVPATMFQAFVDVRGNTIEGEYSWPSDCSFSGIQTSYAATPTTGHPPPIENYGVSISHNSITQADAFRDGAIAFTRGWFAGPPPNSWDVVENTLVFANSINNISLPAPTHVSQWPSCNTNQSARIGEHIEDALVWHTVLSGNSCNNVANHLSDGGTAIQRVCSTATAGSCECSVYLQGNSATPSSAQQTITVPFTSAQSAGNLNVVAIGWNGVASVTSVTDSAGNVYRLAIGPTTAGSNTYQSIYYAANIAGSAANQVSATFTTAPSFVDVRIAEYSGIDPANPIDVVDGGFGSVSLADSGWVTTGNSNDLLVAATYSLGAGAAGPGAGYTQRITSTNANILEDRVVNTISAYDATVPLSGSAQWVAQMVALRMAAGGDTPGTQALTAPSNLSATGTSTSQIELSWSASTDNIGITAYSIERCLGSGCSNFAPVATVTGTTYTDIGLPASTPYTYRVRAIDVANLMSAYCGAATAMTLTGP